MGFYELIFHKFFFHLVSLIFVYLPFQRLIFIWKEKKKKRAMIKNRPEYLSNESASEELASEEHSENLGGLIFILMD